MYKNNSRDSSKLEGCNPLQLHRKLKDLSSTVGYYSYNNRYLQAKKDEKNNTPRGSCERALLERLGPRLVNECRVWKERVKEKDDKMGEILEVMRGRKVEMKKMIKMEREKCKRKNRN